MSGKIECVEMTNSSGDTFTCKWEDRELIFGFLEDIEIDATSEQSASYKVRVVLRTQEQLNELDEDSGFR